MEANESRGSLIAQKAVQWSILGSGLGLFLFFVTYQMDFSLSNSRLQAVVRGRSSPHSAADSVEEIEYSRSMITELNGSLVSCHERLTILNMQKPIIDNKTNSNDSVINTINSTLDSNNGSLNSSLSICEKEKVILNSTLGTCETQVALVTASLKLYKDEAIFFNNSINSFKDKLSFCEADLSALNETLQTRNCSEIKSSDLNSSVKENPLSPKNSPFAPLNGSLEANLQASNKTSNQVEGQTSERPARLQELEGETDTNELETRGNRVGGQNLEKEGSSLKELHARLEKAEHALQEMQKSVEDCDKKNSWTNRLMRGKYNLSSPHPIHAGDPASWQQRTFVPHGSYGFVQYSSYRLSPSVIVIMGMADVHTMSVQAMGHCIWHGNDGTKITGKLNSLYENHHEGAQYTAERLHCQLEENTTSTGGHLVGRVDAEDIVMFREEPGEAQEPPSSFPYQLAYCSGPLHGDQDTRSIRQWLTYHRVYAGTDRFVLYNVDSLNDEIRSILDPHVNTGLVEIVELEMLMSFDFFYFGQMLSIYDCIGSMAMKAKWVFFLDLDEFLEAIPPATVRSILEKHENNSWLSHGALWWDVTKCIDTVEEDGFYMERMVFRRPKIYCFEEPKLPSTRALCIEWKGHRKTILNPRMISMVQVHMVVIWEGEGVDLNAETELRHNHFRGLNVKEEGRNCRQSFSNFDVTEGSLVDNDGWVRDNRLVHIAQEVKNSSLAF